MISVAAHRDGIWSARNKQRLLWLLAIMVLFSGLGLRGPWPADEPRFALVAQTMVQSGDYWFPHRGIEIYPDKPPMLMWLQALGYRMTGDLNIAFLLPSLLAGLATLWLVYDLSKRLFGTRAARLSTLALLLTVHFTYQFKKAQIDPLLVFFVTFSVYALLRHMLLGPDRKWLYLGAFFAGIGVITKGVGVIALLMFVPYGIALRMASRHLSPSEKGKNWLSVFGVIAAFFLAIGCWLLPLLWQVYQAPTAEHMAYLQNILFKQTAQRYANAWHHQQGPLYFPEVMLSTWMPLIFVLPWAARLWWRRLSTRPDARYQLLLGWCVCVLLFFSLSKGKRDMYILPILPMLAVISGPMLIRCLRIKGFHYLCLGFAALLAFAFFGAGSLALFAEPKFELKFEANYELSGAKDAIWMLFAGVGATALATLLGLWLKYRRQAGFIGFCATMTLVWVFVFGFVGYPIMDGAASARLVMARARAVAGEGTVIGLVGWKEQNYLQLVGPRADFGFLQPPDVQRRRAFEWLRAAPTSRALVMLEDTLGACVQRPPSLNLGQANRRTWWLVREDAVKADCEDLKDVAGTANNTEAD